MDGIEEQQEPEVSFQIRKKPLANIVSMVIDRATGYYVVDDDGEEIEISDWHWNVI
jgi:hypothetical protein